MQIAEMKEQHEPPFDLEFACHDCGQPVRVTYSEDEGGGRLDPQDGGAGYNPVLNDGTNEYFVKCADCYAAKPKLTHYNPTEVYTRVVGYYRPVQLWNKGKREEHKDRVMYDNPDNMIGGDE